VGACDPAQIEADLAAVTIPLPDDIWPDLDALLATL